MKTFMLLVLAAALALVPASAHAARGGLFSAACAYDHSSNDDPIVFPGGPGKAHLHDFAGATTTNAFSTAASLLAGPTTCSRTDDHSGYWVPAVSWRSYVVHAREFRVYYRGSGFDGSVVRPFPAGLRLIAGDAKVTDAGPYQPLNVVSWACTMNGSGPGGEEIEVTDVPTSCGGMPLRARIVFPQCWNGRDLDSFDHKSHMAYASRGTCPPGFPVVVPQLTLSIRYWIPTTDTVLLSSGGSHSLHADFMTAWLPGKQEGLVVRCINAGVNCGNTKS